jgi:transcriptional regulator with XRE-family HTH domain
MARSKRFKLLVIEHLRRARGLSQQELALLAGCSQPAISNIERGFTAPPTILENIADTLGWHADPNLLLDEYLGQDISSNILEEE